MTVARTGAHQCAADDGSDSDGGSNNCDDCDCASAAAVATAAAASSTFAAVLCCCLPAGASPLYTVCRHTHAHMLLLLFHCFVCTTHTHTHTHANIQFMHAPVCVSCLPTRRVCNANRAAQRSAVTKPKRRWAAAATATAAEQHNSRYSRIMRCLLSQNFTFSR